MGASKNVTASLEEGSEHHSNLLSRLLALLA